MMIINKMKIILDLSHRLGLQKGIILLLYYFYTKIKATGYHVDEN